MKILKLDQDHINLQKLKLHKYSSRLPNSHFEVQPISYLQSPLIIQTPRTYLPFGTSRSESEKTFLHLSLDQTSQFTKNISLIEQHLHQEYSNYQLIQSIKQPKDPFYPPFIRAKIQPNQIQVYDIFNQSQPLDYITPGSWSTNLIVLKHLWINTNLYQVGLSWFLVQTKVKLPIPTFPPNTCLIDDPWEDHNFCAICQAKIINQPCVQSVIEPELLPEEYHKYTKMLKLGIPILAIVQKCQMDGLNPDLLRQRHKVPEQKTTSNPVSPPLPPLPEPSTPSNLPYPRIKLSMEDLIAGKSSLGTKEIKVRKIKTLNLRKRDPRIPSLNMILDTRNLLRSVDKPTDFSEHAKNKID